MSPHQNWFSAADRAQVVHPGFCGNYEKFNGAGVVPGAVGIDPRLDLGRFIAGNSEQGAGVVSPHPPVYQPNQPCNFGGCVLPGASAPPQISGLSGANAQPDPCRPVSPVVGTNARRDLSALRTRMRNTHVAGCPAPGSPFLPVQPNSGLVCGHCGSGYSSGS